MRWIYFVVAKGNDIWAIEVKSGRSAKTSGLSRFRSRYPEARALLAGGPGIPLADFFSRDAGTGWCEIWRDVPAGA